MVSQTTAQHPVATDCCRLRGKEMTRLETFTDTAFAVPLLVVRRLDERLADETNRA